MICRKCGHSLLDTDRFCKNCGDAVVNDGGVVQDSVNNQIPINNVQQFPVNNIAQAPVNNPEPVIVSSSPVNNTANTVKKKMNPVVKVLLIVGGIFFTLVVIFIIIFVLLIKNLMSDSTTLTCTSDNGTINIVYNDSELVGYSSSGYEFDLDEQKKIAKEMGIDNYIKEFNSSFTSSTGGTCSINGKEYVDNSTDNSSGSSSLVTSTKSVGDAKYGYVDVPDNWTTFYDVSGSHALQYSYAGVYIISMDVIENPEYSAEYYAKVYMAKEESNSDSVNVTGATVKIGKNNEYSTYQVYSYYLTTGTFLITYWFEAEDGNVHYLALEGPDDIVDYLSIPESFSLKR